MRISKKDVILHLNLIKDGYYEHFKDAYLEIRFINDKKKRIFVSFEKLENEEYVGKLLNYIDKNFRFNVFVGMLPRYKVNNEIKGTREYLKVGNLLFFDVDEEYNKDRATEIANFLHVNFLRPTAIVNSGKNMHIYYKLNEVIDIDTLEVIYKKTAEKLMSFGLKVDTQAVDVARAVRLAGSVNWKHVKLTSFHEFSAYYYDLSLFKRLLGITEFKVEKKEVSLRVESTRKYRELNEREIEKIAVALLPFWKVGYRHSLTFTFSSAMKKKGISPNSVWKIIEKVGLMAKDEELYRDRRYCVENVYRHEKIIDEMAGWTNFFDVIWKVYKENKLSDNDLEFLIKTLERYFGEKVRKVSELVVNALKKFKFSENEVKV